MSRMRNMKNGKTWKTFRMEKHGNRLNTKIRKKQNDKQQQNKQKQNGKQGCAQNY